MGGASYLLGRKCHSSGFIHISGRIDEESCFDDQQEMVGQTGEHGCRACRGISDSRELLISETDAFHTETVSIL